MWQVIMFNSLEELNNWLMEEADNIEEVKDYKHQHLVDYFHTSGDQQISGQICNQWEEYTILVKMKEVKL